jgi:GMP reductase
MRIEADIKLDFKDVLIRPKRSTLRSRAEVDLTRTFSFRKKHSIGLLCVSQPAGNAKKEWTGIPIIASNMDTIGTFEMAGVLSRYNMLTAAAKHYSEEDWAKQSKEVCAAAPR